MDLLDEKKKLFEIGYSRNFPVEKFDEEVKRLLVKNPSEIKEKELTDFLSDILFKQDISLGEFTVKLSYWIDSELIERIMRVKYNYRRVKNSQEIRYQKSL